MRFFLWNGTDFTNPEAVWCDELYAEQIEKEEQDENIENNFSRVFKQDNSTRWIFPNITTDVNFVNDDKTPSSSTESDFLNFETLTAKVYRCDSVEDAVYAEGEECEPFND